MGKINWSQRMAAGRGTLAPFEGISTLIRSNDSTVAFRLANGTVLQVTHAEVEGLLIHVALAAGVQRGLCPVAVEVTVNDARGDGIVVRGTVQGATLTPLPPSPRPVLSKDSN